jgi:hypothetical protein
MDLNAYGQELLAQAKAAPLDANQLMNLAIATQCLGQREAGLILQREALALQRTYCLPATVQPARVRLLLLVAEGDLSANTPLDCLFERSDLDLVVHFVNFPALAGLPVPDAASLQFPEHDVLMVGIGVSDETVPLLGRLKPWLAHWPKPLINSPEQILCTDRAAASALLQDVPGMLMPVTLQFSRQQLSGVARGQQGLIDLVAAHDQATSEQAFDFPVIVRPVNSHGGHGLELVANSEQLASYLLGVHAAEFFIAPFIDYRSEDGHFRKIRVALVEGEPFVCHMAVSSHWMVHYVNAGMYEQAWKRAEESAFMHAFAEFSKHHRGALQAIYERTKLDYVCIDCAQTLDGRLLIFEIDHSMVIHAMDLESQFPFKQVHMQKVHHALRDYILRTHVHATEQCA